MNINPYHPPGELGPAPDRKGPLLPAAIGAWLASAYWAAVTLLVGVSVGTSTTSGAQLILPLFLIGLYAVRGFQMFQGDVAAAKRILWLHAMGGAVAIFQILSVSGFLAGLNVVKVAVHIFGGVAAWRAQRGT